jgi:hypothetical protein
MKFIINYKKTNEQAKYRATDWTSFEAEVRDIYFWVDQNPNQEQEYEFIVDGKIVSLEFANEAAKFAREEWEVKRAESKKQVWVRKQGTFGNTANNFHKVWVNK